MVLEMCIRDRIYFLAKQEMPSIAIGTVYRNLNLMVKDEEIRRVQLAGEPDRFDRCLLYTSVAECPDSTSQQPKQEGRYGIIVP